jgi:hypothetical protein
MSKLPHLQGTADYGVTSTVSEFHFSHSQSNENSLAAKIFYRIVIYSLLRTVKQNQRIYSKNRFQD